ncbi:hypothetical protein ACH0B5_13690 [Ureibacillus sp. 179-F W5.1 NHS]|uniref:DUF4375 domain-containing protein n=1 Tax=Lysinibacillus halotolerans TaxID=1368476 RepID=A0A3M8H688_9BACI|nr:hypothetical protein [Lysinibacillus halotolerans]RNC97917.1 hypothetical protein EC501_13190 [Lysinibacillus halotolerans]
MLVIMKREEFDSLADEALFHACFKPLILEYKKRMAQENSTMEKVHFYKELTSGQKALFVFHIYYDHAIESVIEFYWWSAYFIAQPKIWSAIKTGLQFFGEGTMYQLLEETESVLKRYSGPSSLEKFVVNREDLNNNKELSKSIQPLYSKFNEIANLTIKRISDFIRFNHEYFVKIMD